MNNIFQAIGVIEAHIELNKNGRDILHASFDYTFRDGYTRSQDIASYELHISNGRKHVFKALIKDIRINGEGNRRLIVYPKVIHLPQKDKLHILKFALVGFQSSHRNNDLMNNLNHGEFLLSGFWQFIPVCRQPCISVMRNYTEQMQDELAQHNANAKKLSKATHVPVFWKAPEKPFKFNPMNPKTIDRKFVKTKAVLSPERNNFAVVSSSELMSQSPKYMYLPKTKH